MRVLSLFAGIGGFDLGLERAGFKTVAFCEINPFCQRVLAKHWPDIPIFDDVTTFEGRGIHEIDIITAGFPCQGISVAGKGRGLSDPRSGLWFDTLRLIREIRPRWVILENSPALRRRGLDVILSGLSAVGYDAEWHCISAAFLGAPHQRDRIWIIAYLNGRGCHGENMAAGQERIQKPFPARETPLSHALRQRLADGVQAELEGRACTKSLERQTITGRPGSWWTTEPAVDRMVHGLPRRLARWRRASVEALGNAVVPQIATLIGEAIMMVEGRGGPCA